MSLKIRDICIACSKIVNQCHKDICCKICNRFIHKKCTKLKPKELKCLNSKEWVCKKCNDGQPDSQSDLENDVNNLNESPESNITNVDFQKYDDMIFNPLRFDSNSAGKVYNDVTCNETIHKCSYLTPEQFRSDPNASAGKINLLNVNIRSISKNFDSLKECIKSLECEFTVIGISETHLTDKPNNIYNIDGFNVEYMNRIGRKKGGVCLYISERVKYKLRTDLCKANSSYESCFIEIECNTKNIVVGVVYRSHTSIDNFTTDIDPIYKQLNEEKKLFYVMGDFNIDLLKVDTDRSIHEYLEFIYSYSILPTIYKPTRITATTATIIDNILTNNEDVMQSTILVTDISDHLPTILTIDLDVAKQKNCKKKSIFKRKHSNENVNRLKQRLSDVKWQEILDNRDVNDDYNKFIETFNMLYDECVPLKKCNVNRKKDPLSPWITKGLLKSINKKNKLYKKYIQIPTNVNLQKYKTYKNKLNMLIRKSKRMHFYTKFEKSKNNIKETWKEINGIIGKGKKQSPQCQFIGESGNIINNPQDISNQFNDFFVTVGPKLALDIQHTGKNYYDYLHDMSPTSMYMKPIVELDIMKIIDKFNQNKSAGHDNIGNFIIKSVGNVIVKPLTSIFNLSLSTGIVPEKTKVAKVIPIYKKSGCRCILKLSPCFPFTMLFKNSGKACI